ncbi:hypothetical protein [Nocardia bovistercoris]|uniref:Mce-associated membrane protein n=1 Tax=Nocardia bovistercoris TaxID=2785916 RepID=A0A931N461_9NOCA|nr:hypothetical protein [Nocardia bovistercoris]MBH0778402.1 hypothetical protein [Nocardia bovistercoris]
MNTRRPVNRVTSKRRPSAGAITRPRKVAGRVPHPVSSAAEAVAQTPPSRGARAEGASDAPPRRRFGRPGSSWTVVIGSLVAAVLLAGFAAVAATRPGVNDSNAAFVDTAGTEEVRAAAEHALHTIYAYDIKDIDGYQAAVRSVVTGAMLTDLDKFADTTISAIKQSQTSADARVEPIGVTMLTDDRAELLVNLVVSSTKGGAAQQSVAGPVVLRMQKVDGRWLASDIVDR